MGTKLLLFLLLVSTCWYSNARDLAVSIGKSGIVSEGEAQYVQEISRKDQLCGLCEEFTSEAITYLSENKTQMEIITALHKSCSKIPSFERQCIVLVDYYAPLFFLEVSTIQAEKFCERVDLCEGVTALQRSSKNKCDLCHDAVTEAFLKLKDPDTELEIVQLLLKACNSVGKSVNKCKRLVFEYAPVILVNAEQFLETNDICTILHACESAEVSAEKVGETETFMHSAS